MGFLWRFIRKDVEKQVSKSIEEISESMQTSLKTTLEDFQREMGDFKATAQAATRTVAYLQRIQCKAFPDHIVLVKMNGVTHAVNVLPTYVADTLQKICDLTLSKTMAWNPSADTVDTSCRLFNLVNTTQSGPGFLMQTCKKGETEFCQHPVYHGFGIMFLGFTVSNTLGKGATYELRINGVTRQYEAIPSFSKKTRYMEIIMLDQLAYAKQDDKFSIFIHKMTEETAEVELLPTFLIAGERHTLLME